MSHWQITMTLESFYRCKHKLIITNRHVFTVHKIYTRPLYRWNNPIRKILIQLTVQL
jgi:hypothetical protein